MSTPTPIPEAPGWPYCASGADPATDPVGCPGIQVPGHTACLAHLADTDRDAYLAGLEPGADIDHRGTPFTAPLLNTLLAALADPDTTHPRLGHANFKSATFHGDFGSVAFEGDVGFNLATFRGDADFGQVTFQGSAGFGSATFQGSAGFVSATFQGGAAFGSANFQGGAGFVSAIFQRDAWFRAVVFQRDAGFSGAFFGSDARFDEAVFEGSVDFGPMVAEGAVWLSWAVFNGSVILSIATPRLVCRRTRWSSTADLRLRYANVDFAHAVFEYPLTIAAQVTPFSWRIGTVLAEGTLAYTRHPTVRIASLRGVDTAHLVLSDTDLSECLFTGAVHLDQLKLEGACSFAQVPSGTHWRRWRPIRFTPRRTLAEEHHWREPASRSPGLERGRRFRSRRAVAAGAGLPGPAEKLRGRQTRARSGRLLLRRDGDAPSRR